MNARNVSSTEVKPLTKRTQQGDLYVRRADAQLQIAKILTLEEPQVLAMLENSKHRDEKDYLLDETIVYLLREARAAEDANFLEILYANLNRRIWILLSKYRNSFNDQADFEDFGQNVETTILKKLLDIDSDSADFAQIQFGSFVISQAKGTRKQNIAMINREQKLFETARDGEEEDNRLENISFTNELSAESHMIFAEGLRKLTPAQQLVGAMLLDGFQIESNDENELTISRHLGVSSRTIRNWVKEMRRTLTHYHGEVRK